MQFYLEKEMEEQHKQKLCEINLKGFNENWLSGLVSPHYRRKEEKLILHNVIAFLFRIVRSLICKSKIFLFCDERPS